MCDKALINMFLNNHGECATSRFYPHQVNFASCYQL